MSYNFNQFRRKQLEKYLIDLPYTVVGDEIQFEENLKPVDTTGKQQSYFIRIRVEKGMMAQTFSLKLVNGDKEQIIKTFSVGAGTGEILFEAVFSPKVNIYQKIVVESEQTLTFTVEKVCSIYNILQFLQLASLKQIGVQGPTDLLMCVNGEEIQIGRTGIYEVNNGVKITSLGFVVETNDKKNFIVDYQY